MSQNLINKKVRIVVEGNFKGKQGIITSVGNEAFPVHVTLDGEDWETDFSFHEIELLHLLKVHK